MSNEPIVTLVGGLTADPELRFTQNGLAVASFTIAQTPRKFNRSSNEWEEGDTVFMRCSIWRDYAEHVAGSLQKGMQVIATGRLMQRSYQDKQGNNRTSLEMEVDDIGPTLRWATASVQRSGSRTQANNQAAQRAQQGQQGWAQPQQGGAQVQQGWAQPQGAPQQQAPQQQAPQQQAPQQGYGGPQPGDFQPMYQQGGAPQQQQAPQSGDTSESVWNAPGSYNDETPF